MADPAPSPYDDLLAGPKEGWVSGLPQYWWRKLGGPAVYTADPGVAAPDGMRWETTDAMLQGTPDTGQYFRDHAYDQSPEYLAPIAKMQELIKGGMSPQEAHDTVLGIGTKQKKVIGIEGTQNIDPSTGKPWARLLPGGDPNDGSLRALGMADPPQKQDANGMLTSEYKNWIDQQMANTAASADALDAKNKAALEGLAYKRINEGSDPYTGFNATKQKNLQSDLNSVSEADRNILLKYADPINLDEGQRLTRRALRAPDWNEASNDKQVYQGQAGSRFLDRGTSDAYYKAGAPGGFTTLEGSKEFIDPTTGRETVVTGAKGLNYNAPSYDRLSDFSKRAGGAAIGAGFGILTGGTGLAGLGLAALGGAQGGYTGTAPSGVNLAIGTALGAIGSEWNAAKKGSSTAKAATRVNPGSSGGWGSTSGVGYA